MKAILVRLLRDDRGQDLIEYALLAGLIAVVAVAAITQTGTAVQGLFGTVATQVSGAAGS